MMFLRLAVPALALALVACGSNESGAGGSSATPSDAPSASAAPRAVPDPCQNQGRDCVDALTSPPPQTIDMAKKYTATVHMANGGSFSIALDQKSAPVTVNNFVYLAQHKFYDGLIFHRRVDGFVIQGGDPLGKGTGGPAYKLPDETNPSPWTTGSVAMASSAAGINGSQFFVTLADAPFLATNGKYNHFGTVSSGMDVVQKVQVGDKMQTVEITVS